MIDASPIDVVQWIKHEQLEAGFMDGIIDQAHVIPLLKGLLAGKAKWLTKEEEIKEALVYMITMLEIRQSKLEQTGEEG